MCNYKHIPVYKLLRIIVYVASLHISFVSRLPDLFNAREKRGGAWYLIARD